MYDQLNRTDPAVAEALVRHTAGRLPPVLEAWPTDAPPIAGLRLKVVDGNDLAGTDHRLAVLRGHGAALPGMALVVRDHGTGLLTELIAHPDGYTNERGQFDRQLDRVRSGEVWVGDRNVCVLSLFGGIAARGSDFGVRHHAQTSVAPAGPPRAVGRTATGRVFEPPVTVAGTAYRLVVVRLNQPTRDGETEIRLLTNLPAEQATAVAVAETYRLRWTLEASFLEVTRSVNCELATLGYPRAAILCFALALCACNALRVVTQAVQVTHGPDHPGEEVSSDSVASEAAAAFEGLEVVVPATVWLPPAGHEWGRVRGVVGDSGRADGVAEVPEDDPGAEEAGHTDPGGSNGGSPLDPPAVARYKDTTRTPNTTPKGMAKGPGGTTGPPTPWGTSARTGGGPGC